MERITVNMVPGGPLEICHASQFDLGREIAFDLMSGKTAYILDGTETVTLKIAKPDGTSVEDAVPNTSDSYVIWTSDEGDCDVSGVSECEIRVTKGGDLLGSGNFLMQVEPDPYNGKGLRVVTVGPADICTFETTLPEPLPSVLVNVVATGGNGTPDNPNPINGYTEANITRCGKNLFSYDLTIRDGYWTNNAFVGTNAIVPKENATSWQYIRVYVEGLSSVTLSGFDNQGGTNCAWLSSENVNDVISLFNSSNKNGTKTIPSSAKYLCLTIYNIKDKPTTYPNAQLEIGLTATAFAPYNGQTYAIAFGQTVYGGVLDVTTGVLTVTRMRVNLYDKSWTKYTSGNPNGSTFNAPFSGVTFKAWTSGGSTTAFSNALVPNPSGAYYDAISDSFWWNNASDGLRVCYGLPNDQTSLEDFMTFLVDNQVAIIGELATPIVIDLGSGTAVTARANEVNNVFADCGQTEVKYLTIEV